MADLLGGGKGDGAEKYEDDAKACMSDGDVDGACQAAAFAAIAHENAGETLKAADMWRRVRDISLDSGDSHSLERAVRSSVHPLGPPSSDGNDAPDHAS
eukprot:gene36257-21667_t